MGAESDSAELAPRSDLSFTDTGAASTVQAVWGPDDRIYVSDFALSEIRVYEAEDVKCKSGQYDFRLDKDFKVFVITKD